MNINSLPYCLPHSRYRGLLTAKRPLDDFALLFATMAVLEFLAAAAWTWVITSDLLLHMDRHPALLLASVGDEVGARCGHLLDIAAALLWSCLTRLGCVTKRDE